MLQQMVRNTFSLLQFIQDLLWHFSVPPKVCLKEKSYTFLVQSEQILEAQIGGIPPPEVKWFKEDILMEASDHVTLEQEENMSRLRFSQLKMDASGVYKCVAENSVGKAEAKTSIVVHGK